MLVTGAISRSGFLPLFPARSPALQLVQSQEIARARAALFSSPPSNLIIAISVAIPSPSLLAEIPRQPFLGPSRDWPWISGNPAFGSNNKQFALPGLIACLSKTSSHRQHDDGGVLHPALLGKPPSKWSRFIALTLLAMPLTRCRTATKSDVEAHFATHGTGEITEVKLMNGFGFIEYKDPMDAQDVVPG